MVLYAQNSKEIELNFIFCYVYETSTQSNTAEIFNI